MELTYNILKNGYEILNNGKVWVKQVEPFIPNPKESYEENAKAQIEEMLKKPEETQTLEEQVTDLQLAVAELAEIVEGGNV